MPIDRAVPSIIRIAASTSWALRSRIFCWAMSRSWARVTLPTFVLFGRDFDGHNRPDHRGGPLVVGFAELHDVDAVLAQGGADRGSRSGLARGDL